MSNAQVFSNGNGLQNFKIRPSNSPSDNVFAYQGQPVMSFQLPASNVLLDPTSIRLTGKLRFKAGSAPVPATIRLDQYLGVNGCVDAVSWSSLVSRSVLEKINNYQKLLNSVLPAVKNSDSFQSELQSESLATADLDYQANEIISNMTLTEGVAFSTPIFTGITMSSGNRLPLLKLGGLILSLDLASNEAVFLVQDDQTPQYELVDVALTGSYFVPSPEERSAIAGMSEGSLELNTFTSLFSVLQASRHTSQFNLGLKEVIACYFSFVPTSYINNYKANQFQSLRILNKTGGVEQSVKMNFLRNGSQFPFLYDLDVIDDSNEAELQRYYLMALKRLNGMTKTTISALNNDPRFALGSSTLLATTQNQALADNKLNQVYGVPYDIVSGLAGASFANQPLTINVDSNLTDANPNAIYFFVLAKTMIVYNEDGMRVLS
jgi:hypothetical protein